MRHCKAITKAASPKHLRLSRLSMPTMRENSMNSIYRDVDIISPIPKRERDSMVSLPPPQNSTITARKYERESKWIM
jgi:hypothetical protein